MAIEYKLSYTALDIDEYLGRAGNAVTHTVQFLTDEQKAQARENIGAANAAEIEEALDHIILLQNYLLGGGNG